MTEPVLIVGAGPTGLTLACELARRGVEPRIVDALEAPSMLSKAIGIQARTLEILDDMGVAHELVAAGLRLTHAILYAQGTPIARAAFDELDTPYPFLLSAPQSATERVLTSLLERLGGRVERGLELVDLAQEEHGCSAELTRADGRRERVRAAYVIGADGAHSAVRKLASLPFSGTSYDERFLLADVQTDFGFPRDRISTFFSESGILACFPLPEDRWRLIATAPAAETIEDGDRPPTLDEFQALTSERSGQPTRLRDAAWLARFRIHCRHVKSYRSGRLFLAGDAAHIHSPIGGQGLNTGIQDAHNLAWKLALVLQGRGRPELLDSYHDERHAIGVALLRGTDFATRVATLKHPVVRAVRDRVSSFLSSLEIVQQRITRSVAELSLSYAGSPIVVESRSGLFRSRLGSDEDDERPTVGAWLAFDSAPSAGERAPDGLIVRHGQGEPVRLGRVIDGRKHTLLLFDGRAPTPEGYARIAEVASSVKARYADLVNVHAVIFGADRPAELGGVDSVLFDIYGELEDRYGARAECAYLLRPDLYVGCRCQPIDARALDGYFDRIFVSAGRAEPSF